LRRCESANRRIPGRSWDSALQSAAHGIRSSWVGDRPWQRVLDALAAAIPGEMAAVISGIDVELPYWGMSTSREGPLLDLPSFVDKSAAGRYRRYVPSGSDPLANRAVLLDEIRARDAAEHRAFYRQLDSIYPTEEVNDQLRAVVTGSDGMLGWVGFGRSERSAFSDRDVQLLDGLLPTVRAWLEDARALGLSPCCAARGLPLETLNAFAEPALVVRGQRVVFANRAARRVADRLPSPREVPASERVRFLAGDGIVYELVRLGRALPDPLETLPPSLSRIARRLAQGLTDKEIAQRTGQPLSTVRTYVRRTFARLGVSSRREIMMLASASTPSHDR